MEKENKTDERDFSEKEIPYLNSLEPSEFEPRTNTRVISSSSNDDEEEGVKYKVKRLYNSEWCECNAKSVVGRCSSKACNFIKKRLQHMCFPMKFTKFLRTTFFYRTPLLWWQLLAVNSVKQ